MRAIFIIFICFSIASINIAFAQTPAAQAPAKLSPLDDELIYRINFGSTDDIKVLLDKGANPNVRTIPQGDPAIFIAIDRNDKESPGMVKALLDKGGDPNILNNARNTPLVDAISDNQTDSVIALIDKGADVHIRSADNRAMIDIAKQSGNKDIQKYIQDILDKENAFASSLRTPERFKEIIHQYSFHSCDYQYWSYVMSSRQDPSRDQEVQKRINDDKATLAKMLQQIQQYYPTTKTEDLQTIADESAQNVYDQMDVMISNRNRAEHGIGHEEDATSRCQKIADSHQLVYVAAPVTQDSDKK